jgi:hypothetical protein
VTEEVAVFGALAVGYLLVVVGVFAATRRALPSKSFLAAVALALGTLVAALAIFHAVALDRRPLGDSEERFEGFVDDARLVFLAVYSGALAIAFGAGSVLGGSLRRAALTALLVLLFMGASLPYVEFKNACDVGRTLVIGETEC